MTIINAIILGLTQGLTEFLPVSSSGHLLLVYQLLGIDESLLLSVLLHFGTLFAVICVYFRNIVALIKHPLSKPTKLIVVACIPTFLLAALFKFAFPQLLGGQLLPIGFALTIVFITLAQFVNVQPQSLNYASALLIGVVQGFAVLPGLSRSGSTISTARLLGVSDNDAGKFSFLLSIPVILASGLVEGYQYFTSPNPEQLDIAAVIIAIVVAFVSGLLAINLVRKLIKSNHLMIFAIYLIIPLLLSILFL